MAYSTSLGLKYPAPRNASIISSIFRLSSFITSDKMLPFSMMIIGLPLRNLRNLMLFVASFVMRICTKNSENTGITPYKIGMDASAIGIHTRSLATSVIASSKGCNSPSCLLPISRIATSNTKYKTKLLINKLSIAVVCIYGTLLYYATLLCARCEARFLRVSERFSVLFLMILEVDSDFFSCVGLQ